MNGNVRTQERPGAAVAVAATELDFGAGAADFVTDADGVIVDVNEAFTRVTGYPREEAIGATPRLRSSGRQDEAYYAHLWGHDLPREERGRASWSTVTGTGACAPIR